MGCTMFKPLKRVNTNPSPPPETITIPFVDNNVTVPPVSADKLNVTNHISVLTAVLGILLVTGLLCFGPYIYHYIELAIVYIVDWLKSRK